MRKLTMIITILTNIVVKMTNIVYIINRSKNLQVMLLKNRLKELRAREGYNQTELAKRAKVSRQTISLIERGEYMPSLLIAARIARVFNEPIENVFLFEEGEL